MAERAKANRGKQAAAKASKKDNGSKPARAGHNSGGAPDEVMERWLPRIQTAQGALDRANDEAASKRASLKQVMDAAERDGLNRKGIKAALADYKKDAAEVVLIERERGRVHRILGSVLHEQYDLFGGIKAPTPVNPYLQGQTDGREGRACEPPYTLGTPQAEQYVEGWNDGQHQHHESLSQASEPAHFPHAHEA